MHSLLCVSAVFADWLWIFWSGKMAGNSGKLYSIFFSSVSQMLKIRKWYSEVKVNW